jgi:hypothetical protein
MADPDRANQQMMPRRPPPQQTIPKVGTQPGPTQAADALGNFLKQLFNQPQQPPALQRNPATGGFGIGAPTSTVTGNLY